MEQMSEELEDSYCKIVIDINFLVDKLLILKAKAKKTKRYHIGTQLKLLKEIKELEKEFDEIQERLKRLEENPM